MSTWLRYVISLSISSDGISKVDTPVELKSSAFSILNEMYHEKEWLKVYTDGFQI